MLLPVIRTGSPQSKWSPNARSLILNYTTLQFCQFVRSTYTLPESLLMLPILPSVESLLGCFTSPRPDSTSSLLCMELFFLPSVSCDALLLRRWRPISDPILWPRLGLRLRPSVTHEPTSESDMLPLLFCFWKPWLSPVGVRTDGCCDRGIVDLVFIFSLNWLKIRSNVWNEMINTKLLWPF